jgi:hypothetical protein
MVIFATGVSLFTIALAVHVIVWRTCLPRRQLFTLAIVFILTPIAAILFGALMNDFIFKILPMGIVLIALFYFSLAFDYVILFSAIEADSPSLTMIALIQQRGLEGIRREELETLMTLQEFPNIRRAEKNGDCREFRSTTCWCRCPRRAYRCGGTDFSQSGREF